MDFPLFYFFIINKINKLKTLHSFQLSNSSLSLNPLSLSPPSPPHCHSPPYHEAGTISKLAARREREEAVSIHGAERHIDEFAASFGDGERALRLANPARSPGSDVALRIAGGFQLGAEEEEILPRPGAAADSCPVLAGCVAGG